MNSLIFFFLICFRNLCFWWKKKSWVQSLWVYKFCTTLHTMLWGVNILAYQDVIAPFSILSLVDITFVSSLAAFHSEQANNCTSVNAAVCNFRNYRNSWVITTLLNFSCIMTHFAGNGTHRFPASYYHDLNIQPSSNNLKLLKRFL